MEPEIKSVSPRDRAERYRVGVLSTLENNAAIAKRRAAKIQRELDADVAVHVERLQTAQKELLRLEAEEQI